MTLLPIIFGAVLVAWFVLMPKTTSRRDTDAAADVEAPERLPMPTTPTTPDPTVVVAPVPTPTAPPSSSAVAIVIDAAVDAAPLLPEQLAELDAFSKRPPGSDRWTAQERQDHLDALFEDLGRREAALERELDAAERAHDDATAAQKRATLEHLRSRRDEMLAGTRTRPDASPAAP